MEKIFLSVLNMSLTGAFVIVAIMLVRLLLKKAPKSISYALWMVAGFRLVFPFSVQSIFSLLPFKATPIPQDIAMQAVPRINSGVAAIDNAVSALLPAATPSTSVNPLQIRIALGSYIWIFGIALMLIYCLISIFLLKHRLHGATHIKDNLYEATNLKTPFVIGVFKPRIYIPAGLFEEERRYIVLHEQTHIRRHDHLVKMFAHFVLCLHWFNPLAWVAFILMGADMEMSCDEHVIKQLGAEIKSAYSLSLVRVAAGHTILNGSPLAFSEGGMKERVKNVLNFKKHSRVIVIAAVALTAVVIIGFALNRTGIAEITLSDLTPEIRVQYHLENPSEKQKLERLSSVTLYRDGSVKFMPPPISSYIPPRCTSSIKNGELLILADIRDEADEGVFGVMNGDVIARFAILDEKTLEFTSSTVPLFADAGARYVANKSAYQLQVWLDFWDAKEYPSDDIAGRTFPEFPRAEFTWTPTKLSVKDLKGERELIFGMPIWNIYMADLTGDGLPEFCATISFGSGIIDERIIVYDYAANQIYELSDRGDYDYVLFMEDGRLMVKQTKYPDPKGDVLAKGELAIVDGKITAIGIDRAHTGE